MLYLYAGGVFAALVNGYFITRNFALARLITPVVILSLAVFFFPVYMGAVTEINTGRYAEINAITAEIKEDNSAQAQAIQSLINHSLENEKVSVNEFNDIQEAFEAHKQTAIKQSIATGGTK